MKGIGLNFFAETFRLGLKNIHLHKLRSLLTMLGIIFGVAAVIIMVAIGEGSKRAAIDQLKQLGAQNILIRTRPPAETTEAGRATRVSDYGLRVRDRRLLETLPGVRAIVPMRDTQQKVTFESRKAPSANAIGTEPQLFEILTLPLERGEIFTKVHLDNRSPVCVLGASAARDLFPFHDPIGQWITVGGSDTGAVKLMVIGVLEPTGLRPGSGFINRDIDLDIYFPLSLAHATFGYNIIKRSLGSSERKTIELTEVWIQVDSKTDVEAVAAITDNLLLMNHPQRDYEIKVPIEILRNAERLARMFNAIMGSIASFSLIVGGIGIMNIMLASVTERTKEIGIRRALGAKQRHITLQFLVETTVVSLAGGVIGIGLAVGTSTVLQWIVPKITGSPFPTQIASWSVIGAFVVSGLIGIGFGLYPAVTAARMNPIEALRHAG